MTDEESIHLPSRGAIIGIIKDLRRVVFPLAISGDENISSTMPRYFLGNMLTHIYEELKAQIEIAFLYDDKGKSSSAEVTEKAREICERFISRLPYIQKMLLMDVQAGFDGDPAAKSKEDIIFLLSGIICYLCLPELPMNCMFRMYLYTAYYDRICPWQDWDRYQLRCHYRALSSLSTTVQVLLSVRQQKSVIMSSCIRA